MIYNVHKKDMLQGRKLKNINFATTYTLRISVKYLKICPNNSCIFNNQNTGTNYIQEADQ